MPASTFIRRSSNAPSSSNVAGSSGSNAHPNHATMPAISNTSSTVSGNTFTPINGTSSASTVYTATNSAINGNLGSDLSEFGSGGITTAGGFIGRAQEGSSRTTSPSLSPIIGGAQGPFPAANHSLSQSFQASNADLQSLYSATNSTFTNSTFTGSSLNAGQVSLMKWNLASTFQLML
jgi:hypothetical protein